MKGFIYNFKACKYLQNVYTVDNHLNFGEILDHWLNQLY